MTELELVSAMRQYSWMIIKVNLMRHLDQVDNGNRFETWKSNKMNAFIFESFDISGMPWNFQDEGHISKLASWMGLPYE